MKADSLHYEAVRIGSNGAPRMQKPSTIDIDPVIYLAIELSASTWLVVSKIPTSEKTGLHRMEAGNSQALIALIADLRKKVSAKLGVESAVMSCFEAGRDGFWLHRLLSEHARLPASTGRFRASVPDAPRPPRRRHMDASRDEHAGL